MTKKALRYTSLGTSIALLVLSLHGTASAIPRGVPEIDPGSVLGGVGVLTGAALLLIERFRRR